MNASNLWWVFALASAFFAGLTAILGKVGVAGVASNLATVIRTCVVLVFAGALVTMRREWLPASAIANRTWLFLVLSGLATGASWLCYYHALQLAPASKVAPLDKLSVVIAMVLAIVFLREPASPQLLLGGVLIAAGSIVIALA